MRIGVVLYWCVLGLHMCKADDVERTESREGARRQHWGPVVRAGSFTGDSGSAVLNDHSKLHHDPEKILFIFHDTFSFHPSVTLLQL